MQSSQHLLNMNSILLSVTLFFTLSQLELVTGLSLSQRDGNNNKFIQTARSAVASTDEDSLDISEQSRSASPELLDRNLVIACTNRHNCEMICAKAVAGAKFASKSALLDALTAGLGGAPLTDAHKLGVSFGRKLRSCDKCGLIYSNCDNGVYETARQQLFAWRSAPDDMISLPKSSNTL